MIRWGLPKGAKERRARIYSLKEMASAMTGLGVKVSERTLARLERDPLSVHSRILFGYLRFLDFDIRARPGFATRQRAHEEGKTVPPPPWA